jgi:CHAT domain-containing protein/tetratricopeptide (TPR) repeat protein
MRGARLAIALTIPVVLLLAILSAPPTRATAPGGDTPREQFQSAVQQGNRDAAVEAARLIADDLRSSLAKRPADLAAALDGLAIQLFQEAGGDAAARAAETLLREALVLRRNTFGEKHLEVAKSLDTLSTFHYFSGRLDDAEAEERQALQLREALLPRGDLLLAKARDGLGTILYKQGRFAEAEPLLQQALDTFKAARPADPATLSDSLNVLAELARSKGDRDAAEARFKASLAVLGDENAPPPKAGTLPAVQAGRPWDAWSVERARALNNLAGLYKDEGRYDLASGLLEHALRLWEQQKPPPGEDIAKVTQNLAEIRRLQGRPDEAAPLYGRALERARKAYGEDNPDLGWFLNQSSVDAREDGRFEEAREFSDEALALLRGHLGPDSTLLAQALHDRAVLEVARGKPRLADPLLREALEIRAKALGPDHPDTALTHLSLARLPSPDARMPRQEAEAAVKGLDATNFYPDERAEAHALRARLRLAASDPNGALDDLRLATALALTLRPQSGGGEGARAGRFARHALMFDDLALLLLDRGRPAEAFEVAERGRGRALLDQLETARVDLRAAIPEADRHRLAQRETQARGRLAEAQERVAVMRGRADLDAAVRAEHLKDLETALQGAAADFARAREEVLNASPLWRKTGNTAPVSLVAVQTRLVPRHGVLLFYLLGEERAVVLLVPPAPHAAIREPLEVDGAAAKALGIPPGPLHAADAAGAIGAIVQALRRPPVAAPFQDVLEEGAPGERQTLPDRLHALWRVLMPQAVWDEVRRAEEAVIVPDGPLHALPFEALVVEPQKDLGQSRFVLDDGPPLRYTTSASLLAALQGNPAAGSGIVSVSDPDYGAALPRLPMTARESAAIVAASSGDRSTGGGVTVLSRGDATESAVRAALPGRRFVHLAVHGLTGSRLGELFAELALAPPHAPAPSSGGGAPSRVGAVPADESNDGHLRLFEIYDLGLSCDLAVLSACSTQAGRAVEGEGVFALSRGFLVAGARRVVASLWGVDDASTATLMGGMFRSLRDAGVFAHRVSAATPQLSPYARALRDARREVRGTKTWAEPYYWAPFLLTGAF